MLGKSFDGGTYAKTVAKWHLMKGLIVNESPKIFVVNLDRFYDADFEIFGEKERNPSDAEVDFCIGI